MSKVKYTLDSIQSEAVNASLASLKATGKALIHMATGTGKTNTAIKLFHALDTTSSKRLLWLTHTQELIGQSEGRFNELSLDFDSKTCDNIGVFCSHTKNTTDKIIVATIQSLSRHLSKFQPSDFDIIVVDECHHAPAPSWRKVINYFTGYKVGLSGSIVRPDGAKLDEYFGDVAFDLPFKLAQEYQLLARCENNVILTDSVLNGKVSVNGEYSSKQLEKLYTVGKRNETIVASYKKYARQAVLDAGMEPKAICFCIDTAHAIRMSEVFRENGISSEIVSGSAQVHSDAKRGMRSEIMERFINTNEIEILCAVNVLNEGIDVPNANIALMCRPTQSNIIYSQQIGRVARTDNGKKKFFFVLDVVDQTDSDFFCYTSSSITGRPATKNSIVTEYLDCSDPVVIEKRIQNIMARRDEFEANMRKPINDKKITKENFVNYVRGRVKVPLWTA